MRNIKISDSKKALIKNIASMLDEKLGTSDYLITEQDIADKYKTSVENVITLEKEAIPFEIDITNVKIRRATILKNLFEKGLDFYKENKGGLKSDFTDALILNKEGKLLFLLRNKEDKIGPYKWCLPGGHLEKSLSPERNVKKEIKEETGLDILDCYLVYTKTLKNKNKIYYFYCYLPPIYEVVLNEREHIQYKWMSLEDIKKMNSDEFIFDLKNILLNNILKIKNN